MKKVKYILGTSYKSVSPLSLFFLPQNLLITLQLMCRRHSEEAVCPGVVGQRAGQEKNRKEPPKGIAVLFEKHQHPIH